MKQTKSIKTNNVNLKIHQYYKGIILINKYTKKFNLICAFAISSSQLKKKSLVASIQYRKGLFWIPLDKLYNFNKLAYDVEGWYRSYVILHVVKKPDKETIETQTNFFDSENTNMPLSDEVKDLNLYPKSNTNGAHSNTNGAQNSIITGDISDSTSSPFFEDIDKENVNYFKIYENDFFTESFIQKYIFSDENRKNLNKFIFIYDSMHWKSLVHRFENLDIILSGGSTSQRQVLSSVQINLSRFLIAFDGLNSVLSSTREAWKFHKKLHKNNLINNFLKNPSVKYLKQYFSCFEEKEDHNLIMKLYLIYKNSPNQVDTTLIYLAKESEEILITKNWESNLSLYKAMIKYIDHLSSNWLIDSKSQSIIIDKLKKDNNFKNYSFKKNKVYFEEFINEIIVYAKNTFLKKKNKFKSIHGIDDSLLKEEEVFFKKKFEKEEIKKKNQGEIQEEKKV